MLSFPPAASSSVQRLVDAAVPSPFGKGSETVFDPAVRTAAEIKAAQQGAATTRGEGAYAVLDEVRALLQPSATSVVAELDKLNIYGPAGFFKPHYDTPRSQGGWPLL
ncbi:hypothetical protein OEZ85_014139 [Tetradesmus obliquus]|uniref:Prolyl 4-hydroxylase alpha subunit Fe(2+) 2OG dioxygenase domain-containing protein n=1 Tax=Tetradesmus obliquus TaxID=3088 RepID=A0ABY8UA49_TETOB|nr:hypothetical protein OEZ85_014139 [Tetradesmus obliquus]